MTAHYYVNFSKSSVTKRFESNGQKIHRSKSRKLKTWTLLWIFVGERVWNSLELEQRVSQVSTNKQSHIHTFKHLYFDCRLIWFLSTQLTIWIIFSFVDRYSWLKFETDSWTYLDVDSSLSNFIKFRYWKFREYCFLDLFCSLFLFIDFAADWSDVFLQSVESILDYKCKRTSSQLGPFTNLNKWISSFHHQFRFVVCSNFSHYGNFQHNTVRYSFLSSFLIFECDRMSI